MEQLIKLVKEKTGISDEQSKQAIDTVVGFLKDKIPGGLGSQLDGIVSGTTSNLGDSVKDKISGIFGK